LILKRALVRNRLEATHRGVEAKRETLQARTHSSAARLDGAFEMSAVDRESVRACESAEEHGADRRAGLLGRLLHVEDDGASREIVDDLHGARRIIAAVAHRDLLGGRVGPVR
jgi:hypothetical protein